MRYAIALTCLIALTACHRPASAGPPDNLEELGQIAWQTDFKAAQAESRRSGKPMLVLFDEVPGCATVCGFGRTVLSNATVVEAAEALFVPTLIYNNRPQHAALLKSFNEPSWNNPVVRIMGADRTEYVPRHAGDYTVKGLLRSMRAALRAAKRPVPTWLALALPPSRIETATFGMYCFWSGEVAIGEIDGVISTRAGFLDGHEVVEATFDPAVISFERLHAAAQAAGQADRVFARTDAQAKAIPGARRTDQPIRPSKKDDKYQLRRHPVRALTLSAAQRTKINAAVGRGQAVEAYLSPKQRAALAR